MASSKIFGTTAGGCVATLHTLEQERLRVRITDFGATLVSIEAPDRHGLFADVLLGLPTLADYEATDAHFGAIVGRFANRIADGRFILDGRTYDLPRNAGANTLHGGPHGFDKQLWQTLAATPDSLRLRHVSPDGDNGFPGTLCLDVTYSLEAQALRITYEATTDRPTVLNPTNHAYFDLSGGAGDILDHEVTIAAETFLPTDASQIPTGERRAVAGTPFDFRRPAPLRPRIRDADPQLRIARGFDHTFISGSEDHLRQVATAREPASGRRLTVLTTAPGVQFYTGNSLDGSALGRSGRMIRQSDGLCFEAQGFPNAPNEPSFPSAVLRPGECFRSTTVYAFSTD